MQLAERGDVSGFERLYSETAFETMEICQSTVQLMLHGMAVQAALNGRREMVKYLCGTRNVPVDAVPPLAAALDPKSDATTPLVLALKDQDEDLVVYLLSLP